MCRRRTAKCASVSSLMLDVPGTRTAPASLALDGRPHTIARHAWVRNIHGSDHLIRCVVLDAMGSMQHRLAKQLSAAARSTLHLLLVRSRCGATGRGISLAIIPKMLGLSQNAPGFGF